MRLDINLASQPYEDARQFWLRWGTALVAAAILTLALLTFTVTDWFAARRDHAQIASFAHSDRPARPDAPAGRELFSASRSNRTTRDQSQFLNELIERKSLSWTHVLEDLEKVMPSRVHLVSIHPELDADNQLTLKMMVAGDRDRALELAHRMEDSRHFTQTYVETEAPATSGSGDSVQFAIDGIYIPEPAPAPAPAPAPTPKTETSKRSAS